MTLEYVTFFKILAKTIEILSISFVKNLFLCFVYRLNLHFMIQCPPQAPKWLLAIKIFAQPPSMPLTKLVLLECNVHILLDMVMGAQQKGILLEIMSSSIGFRGTFKPHPWMEALLLGELSAIFVPLTLVSQRVVNFYKWKN